VKYRIIERKKICSVLSFRKMLSKYIILKRIKKAPAFHTFCCNNAEATISQNPKGEGADVLSYF
jgi:hypothetical protein